MRTMKNEIELRLIGSLLSDWCKQRAEKDEVLSIGADLILPTV